MPKRTFTAAGILTLVALVASDALGVEGSALKGSLVFVPRYGMNRRPTCLAGSQQGAAVLPSVHSPAEPLYRLVALSLGCGWLGLPESRYSPESLPTLRQLKQAQQPWSETVTAHLQAMRHHEPERFTRLRRAAAEFATIQQQSYVEAGTAHPLSEAMIQQVPPEWGMGLAMHHQVFWDRQSVDDVARFGYAHFVQALEEVGKNSADVGPNRRAQTPEQRLIETDLSLGHQALFDLNSATMHSRLVGFALMQVDDPETFAAQLELVQRAEAITCEANVRVGLVKLAPSAAEAALDRIVDDTDVDAHLRAGLQSYAKMLRFLQEFPPQMPIAQSLVQQE